MPRVWTGPMVLLGEMWIMRYKYILWDSDDTLLDFGEAEKYAFKATMNQLGLPDDRQ